VDTRAAVCIKYHSLPNSKIDKRQILSDTILVQKI
jgi:hypothetical protein